MTQELRILIVEDLPSDVELAERELRTVLAEHTLHVVDNERDYFDALTSFAPDLIISDYMLPAFDGLTALQIARERLNFVPFVILTGSMNEDTAVECMKAGADDYVIKEHMKRLGPAVLSALNKKKAERERHQAIESLRGSEERLRLAQEIAEIGDWSWDIPTGRVNWSDQTYKIFGAPRKEPSFDFARSFVHPDDLEVWQTTVEEAVEKQEPFTLDYRAVRSDGKTVWVHNETRSIFNDRGEIAGYIGTIQDITELHHAREEASRALRILQFAIEQIPIPVIIAEAPHVDISHINQAAEDLLAKTPDDVRGIPLEEHREFWPTFYPDGTPYRPEDLPLTRAVQRGDVIWNTEIIIRRQDGDHWVSASAAPLRDEQGRIIAGIVAFPDLTERKRAELQLKEAILRQNEAVKAGNVGLWDWNLVTNSVHYSTEWKAQIGYEDHEINDDFEEWRSRIHPDDLEPTVQKVQHSVEERSQDHQVEFRFRHKDGSYRWILAKASVLQDDAGRPVRMLGSHADITERKQAEDALRESEERYRGLFNEALDMIHMVDQDGRIKDANPVELATMGYSREEYIGKPIMELIHPDNRVETAGRLKDVLAGREIRRFETALVNKQGEKVFVEANAVPQINDGKVVSARAILRNVTERKLADEERAQLEEQFHQAQKLESIGRLAGGVAHDLNNLLAPILGYGEMLLEDAVGVDPRREPLEEIVEASMRARDLVRQLLAFSRKQALEFKHIEVNTLLKNFEKLLRRTIREDIAIHLNLAEPLPSIKGDVGQLEQVVMNLTVNAQDAMPDGGTLTIETALAELDESYAAERQGVVPGSYVMLVVSDSGCGLDADVREHLFEPFFTTKEKDKGTGLGLATVYGIVKQHGGNIWAYGEPGMGASFKVYLPITTEPADGKEEILRTPSDLFGSETILLVEDSGQLRKLARTILKQRGYTVLVAAGGKEALALLEHHEGPVHMLLTDVVMPDMNGKQLFEQISARYPDIKTLYMSGYTDDVIVHHGVLEEGVHFIQKPFPVNALAIKVRELLDQ